MINRFTSVLKAKEAGIIAWILLVGLVSSILSPNFLTPNNLVNILAQSAVVGIMAIGMTMVIITGGGGIDLSAGSILGISSVVMAMTIIPPELFRDTAAMLVLPNDFWIILKALIFCLGTGAVCGFLNGCMITWAKLPPFIATLSLMAAARGTAAYISAGIPTYGMPTSLVYVGQGSISFIPIPVLVMLALGLIVHLALTRSVFGITLFAVGGNRETARFSGMNVNRLLISVYVLSGVFAAIAGVILSARGNQVHPDAGTGYELSAIGASVIGGTSMMGGAGGIPGAILGAIFMAEVQNVINILNIPVAYMKPVLGGLIVMAVLLDQWHKKRDTGE
ncbi:MAG: ABC transporter permease [Planctomycetota bacterium]|jgi:ribose/xylose/arabinose/galactoside ABC-type transport system permease subunit|nr:ABC transporter permease [Planctomycetota bacterium]